MPDEIQNTDTGGSAWSDPKQDPSYKERWAGPNLKVYKDMVYDKISELLLAKWTEIEPYIEGEGLKSLQKTYRDGLLVTGRDEEDILVVYESDVEANADDEKIEGAILDWLEFMDVSSLSLSIVTTLEVNEEGKPLPPNLILKAPNKVDFNINEIVGTLELEDINLKDNVSQFMKVDKVSTQIDRSKLKEFIDTEFSELSPDTFTILIEEFNKYKKQLPLRFRSDSFFEEYINSNLPTEYRTERFFEEFERIKNSINKGLLTNYNSIDQSSLTGVSDKDLFGWETLTYLVAESQKIIGTTNPIFNQNDAKSWWDTIEGLETISSSMSVNIQLKDEEIQRLLDIIANMTGSIEAQVYGCTDANATNFNQFATDDDASCTYADADPSEVVTVHAIGTGLNNTGPRSLMINNKQVYSESANRGFRLTIIPSNNMVGGEWNLTASLDKTYDVYGLETDRAAMAEAILGSSTGMNDLFVVTSYDAVNYSPLLVQALKSVGGCYPRLVDGLEDSTSDVDAGDYRTPYVLVGSKGSGPCGGYEDVQDDGKFTPQAEILKDWRVDPASEGGWDTGAPDPIYGCTDPDAENYNLNANADDGTCTYEEPSDLVKGCTDSGANNYNMEAQVDDGSCAYSKAGCLDNTAINWDAVYSPDFDYCKSPDDFVSQTECTGDAICVTQHGEGWTCNGSCQYGGGEVVKGCTVPTAWNYNPNAFEDDGSCGCFGTRQYNDAPPPYNQPCQPSYESDGVPNTTTCECDYPNVVVGWSRSSSDCTNYNWSNSNAACICRCKSNKPDWTGAYEHGNIGNCGWGGWSGDDEGTCAAHCDTHCAGLSKNIDGKPQCDEGEAWNGTMCDLEGMMKGGMISKGEPLRSKLYKGGGKVTRTKPVPGKLMFAGGGEVSGPIPSSKNTGTGPAAGERTDIFPYTNLNFTQERDKVMEYQGIVTKNKTAKKSSIRQVQKDKCDKERQFLSDLFASNPSVDVLRSKLKGYLKHNTPCLGVPINRSFEDGGRACGVCGDINGDGEVSVSDVVILVNIILGNDILDDYDCPYMADANGDGTLNVLDVVILIDIIFNGPNDNNCPASQYCTGIWDCEGDGHPSTYHPGVCDPSELPPSDRYDACGVCGGGKECADCCIGLPESACLPATGPNNYNACYAEEAWTNNPNGDGSVIHVKGDVLPQDHCMWNMDEDEWKCQGSGYGQGGKIRGRY